VSTTTGTTGGADRQRITASGAKVGPIDPDSAQRLLARLGARGPELIEVALGAHEPEGTLIGVAAFGDVGVDHAPLIVAVVPDRRRLGIARELLYALADEAALTGLRWFLVSYPLSDLAADALVRTCGLATARRVVDDTVTAVLDTTG
jgi:GNAT superfamily N-acetyltransferase